MSDTLPILIVDDQPKLLRLVIELMTRLGFPEVDGVADGAEALARLRERRYALVISDLAMEPMDDRPGSDQRLDLGVAAHRDDSPAGHRQGRRRSTPRHHPLQAAPEEREVGGAHSSPMVLMRRRVETSTWDSRPSWAGNSTSAIRRLAMNRPVRTGVPDRVTSLTSTTPRLVVTSRRRPLRVASITNV